MIEEKKPDRPNLELELFNQWLKDFDSESDRAAVILGAAKLDLALRELLTKRFMPNPSGQDDLFDADKPISTLSARINVAYRLGLIDKPFAKSLHLVRKIRNEFAHEAVGANLAAGSHRDRVKELVTPFRGKKGFEELVSRTPTDFSEASRYFRTVLVVLIGRLEGARQATPTVDETDLFGIMPPSWIE
jgi:hypothetical protein